MTCKSLTLFFFLTLLISCHQEPFNPISLQTPKTKNYNLNNSNQKNVEKVSTDSFIKIWSTYYNSPVYDAIAKDKYVSGKHYKLLNPQGKALKHEGQEFYLKEKNWCHGALEGSLRVRFPDYVIRPFAYAGISKNKQVNCKKYYSRFGKLGRTRFEPARSYWGHGASYKKKRLYIVPFRSIATDPKVIPIGTVLFIKEAVGTRLELSSGEIFTHDGYFLAADTGGGVKKNQIDVNVGNYKTSPFNFTGGSKSKKFISAKVVINDNIKHELLSSHFQKISNPKDFKLDKF